MKYFNTAINETINNNAAITNEIPPTKRCAHCGRLATVPITTEGNRSTWFCDLCWSRATGIKKQSQRILSSQEDETQRLICKLFPALKPKIDLVIVYLNQKSYQSTTTIKNIFNKILEKENAIINVSTLFQHQELWLKKPDAIKLLKILKTRAKDLLTNFDPTLNKEIFQDLITRFKNDINRPNIPPVVKNIMIQSILCYKSRKIRSIPSFHRLKDVHPTKHVMPMPNSPNPSSMPHTSSPTNPSLTLTPVANDIPPKNVEIPLSPKSDIKQEFLQFNPELQEFINESSSICENILTPEKTQPNNPALENLFTSTSEETLSIAPETSSTTQLSQIHSISTVENIKRKTSQTHSKKVRINIKSRSTSTEKEPNFIRITPRCEELKIISLNIGGINDEKWKSLLEMISSEEPEIIFLCETYRDHNDIPDINGYEKYGNIPAVSKYKQKRKSAGSIIYRKVFTNLEIKILFRTDQAIYSEINYKNQCKKLITIYKAPKNQLNIPELRKYKDEEIILMGDLNLAQDTAKNRENIQKLTEKYKLEEIYIPGKTFKNITGESNPDRIFSNRKITPAKYKLENIDHYAIIATSKFKNDFLKPNIKPKDINSKNFPKAKKISEIIIRRPNTPTKTINKPFTKSLHNPFKQEIRKIDQLYEDFAKCREKSDKDMRQIIAFIKQNFYSPVSDLKISNCETFELKTPIQISEIETAIQTLKLNRASGQSGNRNEMIQLIFKNQSKKILTRLFNLYIRENVLPMDLRQVKLTLIPKDKNNFRPIAVAEPLKQVLDKIIYMRIMEQNINIHVNQSGFMPTRRREENLLKLHNFIRENSQYTIIQIDLQNAYNMIEHSLLFEKLTKILNRDTIKLINLSIRNNFINLENENSRVQFKLERGLPQGNIISPILFNLFINDIFDEFQPEEQKNLLLYADDIIFCAKNLEKAEFFMKKLENYCIKNFLKINYTKSKILEKDIEFNYQKIEKSQKIKYLGMIFDNKGLHVEDNCEQLLKEIFKNTKMIKNKSNVQEYTLTEKILLYKSFVLPHVNNSDILYYIKKEPVQKLHKIARDSLKQILKANYSIKTEHLNLLCNLHDPAVRATQTLQKIGKKVEINKFIKRKQEYTENCKRLNYNIKLEQKRVFGKKICEDNILGIFNQMNREAEEKFKEIISKSKLEIDNQKSQNQIKRFTKNDDKMARK